MKPSLVLVLGRGCLAGGKLAPDFVLRFKDGSHAHYIPRSSKHVSSINIQGLKYMTTECVYIYTCVYKYKQMNIDIYTYVHTYSHYRIYVERPGLLGAPQIKHPLQLV